MMTPAVREFAAALWSAREAGRTPQDTHIFRGLALAAAMDVMDHPSYDPGADARVAWCAEIGYAKRRSPYHPHPLASPQNEEITRFLLSDGVKNEPNTQKNNEELQGQPWPE